MLKQFEDQEIQDIINKKAPGGIKFGAKSKVEIDTSYAKRVPHLHGLDSGMKELTDNSPESETKKIFFEMKIFLKIFFETATRSSRRAE